MRVVLLAAGFATRMYPLTRDFPKPLLEVGGAPILTHILERLRPLRDLREIAVVTNARFAARFSKWAAEVDCEVPIHVIDDGAMENDHRLGALRDLMLASDVMLASDPTLGGPATSAAPEDLVVLAGDNLIDFDLRPLQEEASEEDASLLVVRRIDGVVPSAKHGEVVLAADGSIARFREKPIDPESPITATAIYFFPARAVDLLRSYLDAGGNPDAPGHFLEWLVPRERVLARMIPGRWFDIGDLDSLEVARAQWGG